MAVLHQPDAVAARSPVNVEHTLTARGVEEYLAASRRARASRRRCFV